MDQKYTYYAFISYKREDESWAKWLQDKLEYFKLPSSLSENEDNDTPQYIRPVFRDITDLRPGLLSDRIKEALDQSKYLIALCSPRYSQSVWCDAEIKRFIDTNKAANIIPFIIDGTPYTNDDSECFPPSLRSLRGSEKELLGADIRPISREYAFIQVVASMLDINTDILWKRYLRNEEQEKARIKTENDRLLSLQSRIVAERAKDLLEKWPYDGDKAAKLALEVLPKNIDYPERPWIPEAEYLLRCILKTKIEEITLTDEGGILCYSDNYFVCNGKSGPKVLPIDYSVRLYNRNSQLIKSLDYNEYVFDAALSDDERYIAMVTRTKIIVYDIINQCDFLFLSCRHDGDNIIKFCHDNRHIACVSGKLLYYIDVVSGKMSELHGHRSKIMSIEFDLKNQLLISSSLDKTVIIWDLNNYKIIMNMSFDAIVTYATIMSDDNVFIAVLNYKHKDFKDNYTMIKAFSMETQKNIWNLYLSRSYIRKMQIIKDISIFVIEDGFSKTCLYDFKSGIQICEYSGHQFKMNESCEEITIISSSGYTSSKKTYFIPTKYQLMEEANIKYGGYSLTNEDKKQFYLT